MERLIQGAKILKSDVIEHKGAMDGCRHENSLFDRGSRSGAGCGSYFSASALAFSAGLRGESMVSPARTEGFERVRARCNQMWRATPAAAISSPTSETKRAISNQRIGEI
jgi:hypothetical protein